MIFGLLKLVVWFAGVVVIVSFALPYFGYVINTNYWDESRLACQEKLRQCRKDLVNSGLQGAKEKCDWKCIDFKLIIEKEPKKGDIIDTEAQSAN